MDDGRATVFEHARHLGQWLEHHLAMTVGAGISMLAISVGLTAWMLIRLPDDHFTVPPRPSGNLLVRVGKNVGGVLLILLGIVLSLPGVPGQGFLTILIGLMLTDIPGKRRVELFVLRRGSVQRAITKLRSRYGRAPLLLPGPSSSTEPSAEAASDSGSPAAPVEAASDSGSAAAPVEAASDSGSAAAPVEAATDAGATSPEDAGTDATEGRGAAAASLRDSTR